MEDESTTQEEYIIIERDNSSGPYISPQYSEYTCGQGGRETIYPVAYISGSKVHVNVSITTNCPNDILIRGTVDLGGGNIMTFPCSIPLRESNGQGADLLYIGTSNEAFTQNQIRAFENFDIKWQWSHIATDQADPCETEGWSTFGTSSNPMYVTLRDFDLTNETVAPTYFHTLLDFTCKAADFIQTDGMAIANIWDKINDKTITTADGIYNLTYYANWDCANVDTKSLLNYKDGQCGAFMNFYVDCLKVQGILHSTYDQDHIGVSAFSQGANSPPINSFFVKNWNFTEGNLSNNTTTGFDWSVNKKLKYVGIPSQANPSGAPNGWMNSWKNGNKYNWVYSDFEDLNGIEAQGINSQPESWFASHRFNNIENQYQDPSYGVEYINEQGFEDNAIAAYSYTRLFTVNEHNIDLDGDGSGDDLNGDNQISYFARVRIIFATTDLSNGGLMFFPFNQ